MISASSTPVSAWPRVLEAVPDAQLHIYGDGPLRDVLRTLVEERGLTDSVHLHGFSDRARDAMRTSAVFLSTSAFEGQSLAIGEALTSGLPVVAFDVRYGPRDYVDTGGILVPPDDVDGVAAALSELLTDDAQLKRVGDFAMKKKIYAAYHTHLQGSMTAFDKAFALSNGNKANVDFGHWVAAGSALT